MTERAGEPDLKLAASVLAAQPFNDLVGAMVTGSPGPGPHRGRSDPRRRSGWTGRAGQRSSGRDTSTGIMRRHSPCGDSATSVGVPA